MFSGMLLRKVQLEEISGQPGRKEGILREPGRTGLRSTSPWNKAESWQISLGRWREKKLTCPPCHRSRTGVGPQVSLKRKEEIIIAMISTMVETNSSPSLNSSQVPATVPVNDRLISLMLSTIMAGNSQGWQILNNQSCIYIHI